MKERRSSHDVTNRVDVTDADNVCRQVCSLFEAVYPTVSTKPIQHAFQTISQLFSGHYPGYHPCDTPYHDLQHTLDVTLTIARLLFGFETDRPSKERLGADLCQLGLIVALFHDVGYIRRVGDRRHQNGAVYTNRHISRSGTFLKGYLTNTGMADRIPLACRLIHFTGYEVIHPARQLSEPAQQTLGRLLGTADLLAQMSDRCYLEKCRDRLFFEFKVANQANPKAEPYPYTTPEELIFQTPDFFEHVLNERLYRAFHSVYLYAGNYFMPEQDHYQEAMERNASYLNHVVRARDISLLRRNPPWTLAIRPEEVLLPT